MDSTNKQEEALMMAEQVAGLSRMLAEKGYNGYFQVSGDYLGVPVNMLRSYLLPQLLFTEASSFFPFNMVTVTSRKETENTHIKCTFRVALDKESKPHITDMEIARLKSNGDATHLKVIKIKSPDDIPTRQQANASVTPPKKKMQVKRGSKLKI